MNRWLKYALRKAKARSTSQRCRLHAVVVKGGRVQAEGCNQAAADGRAKAVHPLAPEWMGIHAEMAALRNAYDSQLDNAILYVAGVTSSGKLICSKPCDWCLNALMDTPLKAVVWANDDGTMSFRKLRSRLSVV